MKRFCACLLVVLARAAPTSEPTETETETTSKPAGDIVNLANMISSEELPSWFPSTRCSAGVIHTTQASPAANNGDGSEADFVPVVPSGDDNVGSDGTGIEGEINIGDDGSIEGEINVPDDEGADPGTDIEGEINIGEEGSIEGEINVPDNEGSDAGTGIEGEINVGDEGSLEGQIVVHDSSENANANDPEYKAVNGVGNDENYIEGEIEVDSNGNINEDSIEAEIEIEGSGEDQVVEGSVEISGKFGSDSIEGEIEFADDSGDGGGNGKGGQDHAENKPRHPSNYRVPPSPAQPLHIIDDQ